MTASCKTKHGISICTIKGELLRPYSYDYGLRYCTYCGRVFDTDDKFCPCCNLQLRTKPRGRKGKLDLNKRNFNEPIRF